MYRRSITFWSIQFLSKIWKTRTKHAEKTMRETYLVYFNDIFALRKIL